MSVAVPWAVQCSVRLDRDATLRRVADVFVLYGLEGINDKSEFIVAEVILYENFMPISLTIEIPLLSHFCDKL